MVSYIQRINRRTLTLRNKRYKRLGSDIWGSIGLLNKNNRFTAIMKNKAVRQIKKFARRLRRFRNKKRRFLESFGLWVPKWKRKATFEFTLKRRLERKVTRGVLTLRKKLQKIRRKISLFYFCRLRQRSMRKMLRVRKGVYKSSLIQDRKFLRRDFIGESVFLGKDHPFVTGDIFEARLDVLLYRLNFTQTIYEGRWFVKARKAFFMGPFTGDRAKKKFFSYFFVEKHFHKVPLFHFLSLRYDFAVKRQIVIKHLVCARKFLAFPPRHLLVSYQMMIGLRIKHVEATFVSYPFPGTLATFFGAGVYF